MFAFGIAYAIHPFLQKMQDKKIPKWAGISIIVVIILLSIFLIGYLITTVMLGQLSSFFENIIEKKGRDIYNNAEKR